MRTSTVSTCLAACLALVVMQIAATRAAGQAAGPVTRVELAPGQPPRTLKGTVAGRNDVTYVFAGRQGQTLHVDLKSASDSLYFNVFKGTEPEAVYASDRGESGNKAAVALPADSDYRVVVYLFRNAARRGDKAAFTVDLALK